MKDLMQFYDHLKDPPTGTDCEPALAGQAVTSVLSVLGKVSGRGNSSRAGGQPDFATYSFSHH